MADINPKQNWEYDFESEWRFSLIEVLGFTIALVLCFGLCYYLWARIFITKSIDRADAIELSATFKRWEEQGRPAGKKLDRFMEGRRSDLVISNRILVTKRSQFVAQFALTNLHASSGTLFVSTNGALIWLRPSGLAEGFQLSPKSEQTLKR